METTEKTTSKITVKSRTGHSRLFYFQLPYHTKWTNPLGDGIPDRFYRITPKDEGFQVEHISLFNFPQYSEDCLANALSQDHETATADEWKEALEKVYRHIHGQII